MTDDKEPEGEISAQVKPPSSTFIWPMRRFVSRIMNVMKIAFIHMELLLLKNFQMTVIGTKHKENKLFSIK